MTQLGEMVEVALATELSVECPFTSPADPEISEEKESVAKDDLDSVAEPQANDGGILGRNLKNASNGEAKFVNQLCPAPLPDKNPPIDTRRGGGGKISVKGDSSGEYPYTVAAHHLIPGEASLVKSRLYKKYMVKNGKIKTRSGREFTITQNIGYCVNGAHNGVWLPGNYAIREKTSPKEGVSWGSAPGKPGLIDLDEFKDWCFNYMLACVDKVQGQFHDSHPTYNEKALGVLNMTHRALVTHQDTCKQCEGKDTVPPPYIVKTKLYFISQYLYTKLRVQHGAQWKVPWYTSERFHMAMLNHGLLGS